MVMKTKDELLAGLQRKNETIRLFKYPTVTSSGMLMKDYLMGEKNPFYKKATEKWERKLEEMAELGSEVAIRMGLWSQNDDRITLFKKQMMGDENAVDPFIQGCSAIAYRLNEGYIFSVLEPPNGMTHKKLKDQCNDMKEVLFDSEQVCSVEPSAKTLELAIDNYIYNLTPKLTVLFRDEKRPDPLDDVWKIDSVDEIEFDIESMKFYTAMKETGEKFAVPFKNNGGYLVGGVAGSGKSASFLVMLMAMLNQDAIDLTIIDGKTAPTELDEFQKYGLADVHKFKSSGGQRNYDEILEVVTKFDEEVAERAEDFKEKYGVNNFWNIPVEKRPILKVLLIDECQVFFSEKGKDNDDKQLIRKIQATVENTVRISRAYGGMVCLATQKPSSEAISTDLRDNCGLKLSLRAETSSAESMVIGERGEELEEKYYATKIGSAQQGLAITKSEFGGRERVRFAYYPDDAMTRDLERIYQRKLDEI
ncbi:zonular occludens toxin domain-containing protein [Staphylococcus warneri]|uniref:zonular occludens toxin domain-containing protein n=1 Tax=Staphylococcus warneri TaxID=1292 RepID=UPI0030C01165